MADLEPQPALEADPAVTPHPRHQGYEPIPGYKLLERLGQGGFGEVWKAEAPGGILKALKFVHGDLDSLNESSGAEQELKALSRVKTVRHPFILSLERYDIVDGRLIIVMELADHNLWDRFRTCRQQGHPGIPRDELLRYMSEAAEALDLMNLEYQLQHLDIKPQNLFLVRHHVKVADFGLVKDFEGLKAAVTGGVTPTYAAPETFEGWASRACDQYSLAIVYQELLTGQRPFQGKNAHQLMFQHLQAAPDLSPLPPADRPIIGKALAKHPDQRFPSCEALVAALRRGQVETSDSLTVLPGLGAPPPSVDDAVGPLSVLTPPTPEAPAPLPTPATTVSRPISQVVVQPAATWPNTVEPAGPVAGVSVPALVIGLGGFGLAVVRSFRRALEARWGSASLPRLRFLYLDTDTEDLRRALQKPPTLSTEETVLTRLPAAGPGGRSGDSLTPLPGITLQTLSRPTRHSATAWSRLLGRLSLLDQGRTLRTKLRAELEALRALQGPAPHGGGQALRVYVVASLEGGTGSGMFLDLAYLVRALLKHQGLEDPQVIGLLALPAEDPGTVADPLQLANTYAALTELHHFSAPTTAFMTQEHPGAPPLRDEGRPFSRCLLLPAPSGNVKDPLSDSRRAAAAFLEHDLFLGSGFGASAGEQGAVHRTPGLYRYSWPRQTLIQKSARRLSRRLLNRWLVKEDAALRERVQQQLVRQFEEQRLALAGLVQAYQQFLERHERRDPVRVFLDLLDALDARRQAGEKLQRNDLTGALDHLELEVPTVEGRLDAALPKFQEETRQRFTAVTFGLIEDPEARLYGAEEALRKAVILLTQEKATAEHLTETYTQEANNLRQRLMTRTGNLSALAGWLLKGSSQAAEIVEGLRSYATLRYQALLMPRLFAVYRSLAERVPDQLHEVRNCRTKIGEVLKTVNESARVGADEVILGAAQTLFPGGARDFEDASQRLLSKFSGAGLLDFDRSLQAIFEKPHEPLAETCRGSTGTKRLAHDLLQQAAACVERELAGLDTARLLVERCGGATGVRQELQRVFQQMTGADKSPPGGATLFVPAGEAGEFVGRIAREALPGITVVVRGEEIVLYRERTWARLADLPQLGPRARDAYARVNAMSPGSTHARTDVAAWLPLDV